MIFNGDTESHFIEILPVTFLVLSFRNPYPHAGSVLLNLHLSVANALPPLP